MYRFLKSDDGYVFGHTQTHFLSTTSSKYLQRKCNDQDHGEVPVTQPSGEWWPRALAGGQSSLVGRGLLFRKALASGIAFSIRLNLNLGLRTGWRSGKGDADKPCFCCLRT